MTRIRPVLRYPGSKWMSAPWILEHLPAHHTYVEPYGGSAAVLMAKRRSKVEVWNDLNDDLWSVFFVLRNRDLAWRLKEVCRLTPYSRTEFRKAWEPFPENLTPVEQARRTLVRSWMGYTGRITSPRNDPATEMRLPAGYSRKTLIWPGWWKHVEMFTERLQGVFLEHDPAITVIDRWDRPGTTFYVDPPYDRQIRHDDLYGDLEMDDADQAALAECLGRCVGAVVLSGYPSPLYDDLYSGWTRVDRRTFNVQRNPRIECLWLNDVAADLLEPHPQRTLEIAP